MLYTFNHYYLTTHIGRRGSRDIYLSYPMGEPEHKVILKIYDPGCQVPGTNAEDFLFTARRFKQLTHAHLIPILDIGLEEGKPYVVSDYIANGSLRQHIEQRPANRFNLDEAVRITLDIGTAIVYAHAHTIIHKDIRPENILFNESGEALLGDFALGELIQERSIQHQLDARTLNYMAPEQLNSIATPKSDQYALGCLLYELITGSLPFGTGTGSLLDQPLTAEPTPPSAIVTGIPKAIEATILQALSRQQGERYPDVETFLNSLQAVSRPAPPIFPFARLRSQPSIADAPTGETGIQIRSASGPQAQQPAEETKPEDTSQQITEHEDIEDGEDEDQVPVPVPVAPFFEILTDEMLTDPAAEIEDDDKEDTLSTALASSSMPGSKSPSIPSPRVMFPLMHQYSQQQDDTPFADDDPFTYISTPVAAVQPEDKVINRNAAQYPKAEALVLPADPIQPGQLAVISQQPLSGPATVPPQSSRSNIIQAPSRRRANSLLLIALVSIILETILSTSFNATITVLYLVGQFLYLFAFATMLYYFTRPINWVNTAEAAKIEKRDLPKITLLYPVLREPEEMMRTTLLSLSMLEYPPTRYRVIAIPNSNDGETIASLGRLKTDFPFLEILLVPPTKDPGWETVWKAWETNPKAYWWHQGKYQKNRDLPPKKTRQLIYAFYTLVAELGDDWLLDYIDADSVLPTDHFMAAAAGMQKYDVLQSTNVAGNLLDTWAASFHAMDHMAWDGLIYPHMSANGEHPFWVLGKGLFYKAADLREVGSFNPWITIEDPEVGMRLWTNGKKIGIIANPLIEEVPITIKTGIIQRSRWVCGFFQSLSSPLNQMGMSFWQAQKARLNFVPCLSLTVNVVGLPLGIWALYEWFNGTSPLSVYWVGLAILTITSYVLLMTRIYIATWQRTSLVLSHFWDRVRYLIRVNPLFLWVYWLIWFIPIVIGFQMFLRDRGHEWIRTEKVDANHVLVRKRQKIGEGVKVQTAAETVMSSYKTAPSKHSVTRISPDLDPFS